jgi:hypothetical protein
MTESESTLRSKIDIVFKYIKEKDNNFISKTLLALKQLLFNKNVNSLNICRQNNFIGFLKSKNFIPYNNQIISLK